MKWLKKTSEVRKLKRKDYLHLHLRPHHGARCWTFAVKEGGRTLSALILFYFIYLGLFFHSFELLGQFTFKYLRCQRFLLFSLYIFGSNCGPNNKEKVFGTTVWWIQMCTDIQGTVIFLCSIHCNLFFLNDHVNDLFNNIRSLNLQSVVVCYLG